MESADEQRSLLFSSRCSLPSMCGRIPARLGPYSLTIILGSRNKTPSLPPNPTRVTAMSFVYICLPDLQRGRPRWALVASETPASPTSQVHMFRIVDSGASTANTVNFLLEETSTSLGLLSNGDYVGAIYIGHTTDIVESHQEFVDYIIYAAPAGMNRPGKRQPQSTIHTSISITHGPSP